MKKISVVMAFVLTAIIFVSCAEKGASSKVKQENLLKAEKRDNKINVGAPAITFDKEVFDFGTVDEGDIVEHSFLLTNSGKSDLVITEAKATCGCTVPTWPKEAIAPGESAPVKVVFKTAGKKNKQSKTVTLQTNTSKGVETVQIKGMVTPKKKA